MKFAVCLKFSRESFSLFSWGLGKLQIYEVFGICHLFNSRISSKTQIFWSKFESHPDFGGRIWSRSKILGLFQRKTYILGFIFGEDSSFGDQSMKFLSNPH